jgi:hypothetical protein
MDAGILTENAAEWLAEQWLVYGKIGRAPRGTSNRLLNRVSEIYLLTKIPREEILDDIRKSAEVAFHREQGIASDHDMVLSLIAKL